MIHSVVPTPSIIDILDFNLLQTHKNWLIRYCFKVLHSHLTGDDVNSINVLKELSNIKVGGINIEWYHVKNGVRIIKKTHCSLGKIILIKGIIEVICDGNTLGKGFVALNEIPTLQCRLSLAHSYKKMSYYMDWDSKINGIIIKHVGMLKKKTLMIHYPPTQNDSSATLTKRGVVFNLYANEKIISIGLRDAYKDSHIVKELRKIDDFKIISNNVLERSQFVKFKVKSFSLSYSDICPDIKSIINSSEYFNVIQKYLNQVQMGMYVDLRKTLVDKTQLLLLSGYGDEIIKQMEFKPYYPHAVFFWDDEKKKMLIKLFNLMKAEFFNLYNINLTFNVAKDKRVIFIKFMEFKGTNKSIQMDFITNDVRTIQFLKSSCFDIFKEWVHSRSISYNVPEFLSIFFIPVNNKFECRFKKIMLDRNYTIGNGNLKSIIMPKMNVKGRYSFIFLENTKTYFLDDPIPENFIKFNGSISRLDPGRFIEECNYYQNVIRNTMIRSINPLITTWKSKSIDRVRLPFNVEFQQNSKILTPFIRLNGVKALHTTISAERLRSITTNLFDSSIIDCPDIISLTLPTISKNLEVMLIMCKYRDKENCKEEFTKMTRFLKNISLLDLYKCQKEKMFDSICLPQFSSNFYVNGNTCENGKEESEFEMKREMEYPKLEIEKEKQKMEKELEKINEKIEDLEIKNTIRKKNSFFYKYVASKKLVGFNEHSHRREYPTFYEESVFKWNANNLKYNSTIKSLKEIKELKTEEIKKLVPKIIDGKNNIVYLKKVFKTSKTGNYSFNINGIFNNDGSIHEFKDDYSSKHDNIDNESLKSYMCLNSPFICIIIDHSKLSMYDKWSTSVFEYSDILNPTMTSKNYPNFIIEF